MNTPININIDAVLNDLGRQTGKALDAHDVDGNQFEDFISKDTEQDDFDRNSRAKEESHNRTPAREESYEHERVEKREYVEADPKNSQPLNEAHSSSTSSDIEGTSHNEAKPNADQNASHVDAEVQREPASRSQDGSQAPEQQSITQHQNGQTNLAVSTAHLKTLLQEGQTVSTAKPETKPAIAAVQNSGLIGQSKSEVGTTSSEIAQTSTSPDSNGKTQVSDNSALVDKVAASIIAHTNSNRSVQSTQQGLPAQASPVAQVNVRNPIAEQAKVDPQGLPALPSASANQPNIAGTTRAGLAEQPAAPVDTEVKPNPIPTPQGRHDPLVDLNVGQRPAEELNLKNDINVQALLAGRAGQAAGAGSNARGTSTIKTQVQSTTEAAPSPNAATQQDQVATTVKFTPIPQALAVDLSSGDTMMSRDSGQTPMSGIPEIAGRSAPLNQPTIAAARSAVPISNSAAVLNQIALQISKNVSNGTAKFEILMDPPELGRIEVRMELNNEGRLQAHLLADKQETLDLMQRDARQLEKALGDLGVDADSDSLEFSLRDEDQAHGFTQRDGDETQNEGADSDKYVDLLSLPPDLNVGVTMETYGFKVREPIGINLNV